MTPSIAYQQSKDTIKQSLPKASHLMMSLIELFGNIDEHYTLMGGELDSLDEKPELRIAAAQLKDTYNIVEELLSDYAQHIASLAMDDINHAEYANANIEKILAAKEIAPDVNNVVYELSAQLADFNQLFVGFAYNGIENFNVSDIQQRQEVNKKVARIAQLLHEKLTKECQELKDKVNGAINDYQEMGLMFEAVESVKGKYFVSLIPDVSLIEVGKTEHEVRQKTEEYFSGDDVDSEYTIKPCSQELYNAFTIHGEIPEEWEEVDGVVVLPEEKELHSSVDTSRIDESPSGMMKAARLRVRHEIEEVLNKQLDATHFTVKDGYEDDYHYTLSIVPDLFITKEPFTDKDKRVVEIIRSRLNDHDWFEEVDLDETRNGTLVLTMEFGDVNLRNGSLNLSECAHVNSVPASICERVELSERSAEATFKAIMTFMVNEIQDVLKDHLEERHFKLGRYRNLTHAVLDIQPDKIFGDGILSENDCAFIEKLSHKIKSHSWIDDCEAEFPDSGEALIHINTIPWNEIDLRIGFKLR